MEPLTYQEYLANPALCSQMEREARHMRAEAVHREFAAVFRRLCHALRVAPGRVQKTLSAA